MTSTPPRGGPHGPGPEFYPPPGGWPAPGAEHRPVAVQPQPVPVQQVVPAQPSGTQPTAPPHPALPPAEGGPSTTKRVLVWVAIGLLFGVCAVLTVLTIALETGLNGLVVGFVLAIIPVAPVVAAFLWLDRHEAEPVSMLLFAFGWGAAVATLVSLLLNTASTVLLYTSGGDPNLALFTVAPLVEESTKGLAVVGVLLLRRREFDGVVDGIVYAGMAGIGFAFIENILYFGRSFVEGGGGQVAAVFVMRGIFSPFAHPLFTLSIGVGIGLAVTRRSTAVKILAPFVGWVVAVLLHAAWNGSTLLGMQGFLGGYAFLQFPVFAGAIALAVMARRREARLIGRHLQVYAAAGWLTPPEAVMLSSLAQRRTARTWARRTGGETAATAMRDFQELASEVAFLRERMVHGTAPHDAAQSERMMLQTMWHLRPRFTPRHPLVPQH